MILCKGLVKGWFLLQKLFKIRPAFSHSLSIVVGRKLSAPNLLVRALMGAAALLPHSAKR